MSSGGAELNESFEFIFSSQRITVGGASNNLDSVCRVVQLRRKLGKHRGPQIKHAANDVTYRNPIYW